MTQVIGSISDLIGNAPAAQHVPQYDATNQVWRSTPDRVFNVMAPPFNAVGDGVTDDTAAVQAAITACGLAGGGTVYFPAGFTFLCNTKTGPVGGLSIILEVKYDHIAFRMGAKAKLRTTQNAHLLWIHGASKPAGFASWNTHLYANATAYGITGGTRGARTLTCSTAGDAANFAAGDLVRIRTGQLVAASTNEPDSEINEVVSADAGTGIVTLKYPLAKDYAQEYFISGTTGLTNRTVTANLAVFGIEKVTDRTLVDIDVSDCALESTGTQSMIRGDQVYGFRLQRNKLTAAASIHSMSNYRNGWITDNEMHITATGASQSWFTAATGCGDITMRGNHCTARNVGNIQINEGCFNVRCVNNHFISTASSSSEKVIGVSPRPRNVHICDNVLVNSGIGSMITIDPGQDEATSGCSGVCRGNILEGGNWSIGIQCNAANWVGLSDNVFSPYSGAGSTGQVYQVSTGTQKPSPRLYLSAWLDKDHTTVTLGNIPPQAYITGVRIHALVGFNSDGTDTVSVGEDGLTTRFSNAVDVSTAGVKTPTLASEGYRTVAYTAKAYYLAGGSAPTLGKVLATLEYFIAPVNP